MPDEPDLDRLSRLDIPFKNLILTGFVGVGKTTIGRHVARQLGVDFFDVDEEIELRELMSISKLRELYGDSRLRSLEHDLCRQAALMRRTVVVASGGALLDTRNYEVLNVTGPVVCLVCELGEALRRLHIASEQHYRDPTIRRRTLSRLRREYAIVEAAHVLQLDTTHLTMEEETRLLIKLWVTGEPEGEHFRYGPPPRIQPPMRPPIGLASRSRT
jgi:shikimate kinase